MLTVLRALSEASSGMMEEEEYQGATLFTINAPGMPSALGLVVYKSNLLFTLDADYGL